MTTFGKKIIQNLPFVNFDENPEFFGMYRNTLTLGDKEETKFDVNVFIDMETGEEVFVTDSYTIKKAIKETKEKFKEQFANVVFFIKFIEKSVNGKGQPLNIFEISVGTEEEYKEYIKSNSKKTK